jgi:hypothetical protein
MQGTKLTCLVYQKLKLKQNHLPQGTQTKIPCISKAKFKGQIQRKYIFFKFIYFISKFDPVYIFLSTHSDAIPVQNSVLFTITDTVIFPVCYVIRDNNKI